MFMGDANFGIDDVRVVGQGGVIIRLCVRIVESTIRQFESTTEFAIRLFVYSSIRLFVYSRFFRRREDVWIFETVYALVAHAVAFGHGGEVARDE